MNKAEIKNILAREILTSESIEDINEIYYNLLYKPIDDSLRELLTTLTHDKKANIDVETHARLIVFVESYSTLRQAYLRENPKTERAFFSRFPKDQYVMMENFTSIKDMWKIMRQHMINQPEPRVFEAYPIETIKILFAHPGFAPQIQILESFVSCDSLRWMVRLNISNFTEYSHISDTFVACFIQSIDTVEHPRPDTVVLSPAQKQKFGYVKELLGHRHLLPYSKMAACNLCSQNFCLDSDKPLLFCGGCRTARYCCAAHQKVHWPYHKSHCKEMRVIRKKYY